MSGLDEGRLLAYLDGELEPGGRAEVEAWLEESDAARAALDRVRERRSMVGRALRIADAPLPDLEAVRARVRVRANGAGHPAARSTERGWGMRSGGRGGETLDRRRLAQAAVLVLLLGAAGVSAAVPGSPVRGWLVSLLGEHEAATVPALAPLATEESADEMGLRVRPSEGRLTVELSGLPEEAVVAVRLVDDDQGAVYAPKADFRSGAGRIEATLGARPGTAEADAADAGRVRVEIPRGAAAAVLRVDGRVWLRKEGERLDFPGPAALVSSDSIVFRRGGG